MERVLEGFTGVFVRGERGESVRGRIYGSVREGRTWRVLEGFKGVFVRGELATRVRRVFRSVRDLGAWGECYKSL